jgi:hypothetical protein
MLRILYIIILLILPMHAMAQQVILEPGTIDIKKLEQENLEMSRMLDGGAVEAGLIKKREYCLTCASGARLGCSSPIGGEAGKVWCSGQCLYKCDGSCGIAYGGC